MPHVIESFAKSLKVIGNGTVHRSHTSSYSSSIVTMAISCIFYPSFSSVTLDTITHARALHYIYAGIAELTARRFSK